MSEAMSDDNDNDEYIGDGVYLSDGGDRLWLAVDHYTNKVMALDITTFNDLVKKGRARFLAMAEVRALSSTNLNALPQKPVSP